MRVNFSGAVDVDDVLWIQAWVAERGETLSIHDGHDLIMAAVHGSVFDVAKSRALLGHARVQWAAVERDFGD